MTDHPARWFIAVLVVFIATRSGVYLAVLHRAIKVLEGAEHPDDMAIYAARNRYRLMRWLLTAQGFNVVWAVVVVTTDVAVTWHTLAAFSAVFAGQLAVAWGIRSSSKGDAKFLEMFRDRAHTWCSDFSCPYRQARGHGAPAGDAPWKSGGGG